MAKLLDAVGAAVARGALALPPGVHRVLAGRPVVVDGQQLDPEIQVLLKLLERSPGPALEDLPVPDARAKMRADIAAFSARPRPVAEVRDLRLGDIPARLYVAEGGGEAPQPLLVYFHGGGWVVCDLDTHDSVCRLLASAGQMRVLSVDYRLAPEAAFPAAAEDALAAFRHAVEHAGELGIDPERVAVGGDSAGGNLAAVTCLMARDAGGPQPAFQLLFYPVCDLSRKRRSYQLFRDGFVLTERQMDWYRDHYLPDAEAAGDHRASPLLADDLSGLPPAYVATAGFDVLRDEGEEYAARLREAGVRVALRRHPGVIHGFVNLVDVGRVGRECVLEAVGALRMALSG